MNNAESQKNGKSMRYEYNSLGEMLKAYDHAGHILSVEYDMLGRRLVLESLDLGRNEYSYDKAGNIIEESVFIYFEISS